MAVAVGCQLLTRSFSHQLARATKKVTRVAPRTVLHHCFQPLCQKRAFESQAHSLAEASGQTCALSFQEVAPSPANRQLTEKVIVYDRMGPAAARLHHPHLSGIDTFLAPLFVILHAVATIVQKTHCSSTPPVLRWVVILFEEVLVLKSQVK